MANVDMSGWPDGMGNVADMWNETVAVHFIQSLN